MPMNPRLLRPTEGGFRSPDADARAYLAAVRQADGANLEPAVAKAISDFVIGCKTDGIWNAIKASCILAGARTLTGALTPLKGTAPTNNGPFVSGDYTRGGATPGLVGNGTSKWLNSNRNTNADGQDNQHLAVYASTLQTSGTFGIYIGQGSAAGGTIDDTLGRSGITPANLVLRSRTANTAVDAGTGLGGTVGLIGLSRSASGSYTARGAGTNATITRTSGSPPSQNISVFARQPGNDAYVTARLAFYSIGESLDLALLDTRVSALMTAIGAAIP